MDRDGNGHHRVRFDPKIPPTPPHKTQSHPFDEFSPSPRKIESLSAPIRAAVEKFQPDADPTLLLPSPHTSPIRPRTDSLESRRDRKGKGRADDYGPDLRETSGFLRVQGKERELVAAREKLDRNERRIISERKDAENATDIERDRDRDKQRIKMLEEEIEHLKHEVRNLYRNLGFA